MTNSTTVVYAEQGVYAGWPANHGAWQWGREWLVGFLRGAYVRKSMHNIREPYEYCFARSMDEGVTWTIEPHAQEFEAGVVLPPAPVFDMRTTIRRVCGVYDHGGDETDRHGGFFLSEDRGRTWHGPYLFTGLEEQFNGHDLHCTARQCELPDAGLLFLSNAERLHWGTDRVFVARHDGERFRFVAPLMAGTLKARQVMPSVAVIGSRIVVVCRRRHAREAWVDSCVSDDGGLTWQKGADVGNTGGSNGNPPALIESNGLLYCAFGDRNNGTINYCTSEDGLAWSERQEVAQGIRSDSGYYDLGYPRLFKRQNGKVFVVYYVATEAIPQQHIAMTELTSAP